MKKIYALLSLMTVGYMAQAQTPRVVLYEHFTQASCPPCAQQNPPFHAFCDKNAGKLVTLKYQTSWPGVDPMNKENAPEVQSRVDYYKVNGVPNVQMDGGVKSGGPTTMSQADLDNEIAKGSKFTMDLNHNLSKGYDSIYVTCEIEATAAAAGDLVAQVAIVEKAIKFANAPGTNGEKEFYNVMRKMLPNANGSTLNSSYTIGDKTVLTFAVKLPSYIRDLSQVAVVGFIQDKTTKEVFQASYSEPKMLAEDAIVKDVKGIPAYQCTENITPNFILENHGAEDLTSAEINYNVDGGANKIIKWDGKLAPAEKTTVNIPAIALTNGAHNINISVATINGGKTDFNTANNTTTAVANILLEGTPAPYVQDYSSTAFPPKDCFVINPNNADTWIRSTLTSAGNGAGSMKIILFYGNIGERDEFYIPKVDMTKLGDGNPVLSFDYAHCPVQSTAENDQLLFEASTDCGATWKTIYTRSGTDLFTVQVPSNSFYNPTASQWKTDQFSLNDYKNAKELMIRVVSVSGKGNNLYVDNINYKVASSIKENAVSFGVETYPNPAVNNVNINLNLKSNASAKVQILNMAGQVVKSVDLGFLNAGANTSSISTSNLESGMYIMNITVGAETTHKSLNVIK